MKLLFIGAECTICSDKLFDGQELNTPFCGHVFHRKCIRYALHKKPECPVCRKSSNRRDLVVLFFGGNIFSNETGDNNTDEATVGAKLEQPSSLVSSSESSINNEVFDPNTAQSTIDALSEQPSSSESNFKNEAFEPSADELNPQNVASGNGNTSSVVSNGDSVRGREGEVVPAKIVRRRVTKDICRFNFGRNICVFCFNSFVTVDAKVACDKCITNMK
ncbi:RING-H2 finger protein ATL30-like [Contarinia nasturtii]|uniref:RING-H2 finger protein ATL30-like n=1 Tax=Contarinia nasturtii TaxID=265458 RepID=UPI0012D3DEB6|nr:RING-H2 finger protein ATL30-like [Contarinia nasturtii]